MNDILIYAYKHFSAIYGEWNWEVQAFSILNTWLQLKYENVYAKKNAQKYGTKSY